MASIEFARDFRTELQSKTEDELVAQDLVQQGAVHAISFLIEYGCTKEVAVKMLESLRDSARMIREEAARRGKSVLFDSDQIVSADEMTPSIPLPGDRAPTYTGSVLDQLETAAKAADHAIGSLMAVRDGISDESLQSVRDKLQRGLVMAKESRQLVSK